MGIFRWVISHCQTCLTKETGQAENTDHLDREKSGLFNFLNSLRADKRRPKEHEDDKQGLVERNFSVRVWLVSYVSFMSLLV